MSFKLAAASLEKGQMPDAASIRSEEFINAFDYRDPEATPGAPIAYAWERARYPFVHNRDLLRFSLKTAAAGRQAGRPMNRFGFALAAGDFDSNGYADLAVGTPFEDLSDDTNAGHVSILYGRSGGLDPVWATGEINQPVDTGLSGAEPGDLFGFALAVGDFDHNGREDLAIGAPGEAVGTLTNAGLVDVIYSDDTGLNPAFRTQEFYQNSANMPGTSETGDRFGAAVATGDFDNSRPNYVRDDLAIGIPGQNIVFGVSTLTNVGAVTTWWHLPAAQTNTALFDNGRSKEPN